MWLLSLTIQCVCIYCLWITNGTYYRSEARGDLQTLMPLVSICIKERTCLLGSPEASDLDPVVAYHLGADLTRSGEAPVGWEDSQRIPELGNLNP